MAALSLELRNLARDRKDDAGTVAPHIAIAIVALFALVLDMGLPGVFWGITVGNLIGAFFSYAWGKWYLRNLLTCGETLDCEEEKEADI